MDRFVPHPVNFFFKSLFLRFRRVMLQHIREKKKTRKESLVNLSFVIARLVACLRTPVRRWWSSESGNIHLAGSRWSSADFRNVLHLVSESSCVVKYRRVVIQLYLRVAFGVNVNRLEFRICSHLFFFFLVWRHTSVNGHRICSSPSNTRGDPPPPPCLHDSLLVVWGNQHQIGEKDDAVRWDKRVLLLCLCLCSHC